MKKSYDAVLFDLDGTLLDTAPDMARALNQLLKQHAYDPLPFERIRPHVAHGARSLLKAGMNIDEDHPHYTAMLEEFLKYYDEHFLSTTAPFPEMMNVLDYLTKHQTPWGIVTNKPSRFTFDLLKQLDLLEKAACIICGDTLTKRKPNPDQIIHACELMKVETSKCLYIGDSKTDVIASRAAGMPILVALYGYIHENEDPFAWKADGYIETPNGIINWLESTNRFCP